MFINGAVDEWAGGFIKLCFGRHAVNLGSGGKNEAFFVFHALAHDVEIGFEIEFEDIERTFDVLGGIGDGDQWDNDVALLDVVFDPLAVDGDVALDESEAIMGEEFGELVVADVHAKDLPVFLFKNGGDKAAADEAVGSEDEDFEWLLRHGIRSEC